MRFVSALLFAAVLILAAITCSPARAQCGQSDPGFRAVRPAKAILAPRARARALLERRPARAVLGRLFGGGC